MRTTLRSSRLIALLCALAVAVCSLVARPFVEMGLNDDWSYIFSAKVLAETGRVTYNGWATAILGWQMYVGALTIRVFGFSYTAPRMAVLVVSMVTVFLLHRLLGRLGLSAANTLFATLLCGLSPLFLPLAFSFMSDVPGFLFIVFCLYGCVRAVQAGTDRAACGWMAGAALGNALGGSVRQIAWLGVLVAVPATAWLLRRRKGVAVTAGVCWAVGVAIVVGVGHWFKQQPYSITEKLIALPATRAGEMQHWLQVARALVSCGFFLLPVLVAFVVRLPLRNARARVQSVVAGAVVALFVAVEFLLHKPYLGIAPFTGNTVGPGGFLDVPTILGTRPVMFPLGLRVVFCAVTLAAVFALLICRINLRAGGGTPNRVPGDVPLYVLGPFSAAYFLLMVTRGALYDRYLFVLVFLAVIPVLRFYQERFGDRLPGISGVALALFTVVTVAGMHDAYALARARLAAANQVVAAGVPRRELRAGFEYDAWTQLELTGYVNEDRLKVPVGAFRPFPASDLPVACRPYFEEHTPGVRGRYLLAFDAMPCYGVSPFPAVEYQTWFPSTKHEVLTLAVR